MATEPAYSFTEDAEKQTLKLVIKLPGLKAAPAVECKDGVFKLTDPKFELTLDIPPEPGHKAQLTFGGRCRRAPEGGRLRRRYPRRSQP